MSRITTHVLDTARGAPAAGMVVVLERQAGAGGWARIGGGVTDADGRARDLMPEGMALELGSYRLVFSTGAWAAAHGGQAFFPEVAIAFAVTDPAAHHHVPLLLSPFGYSTYRGS